MQHIILNGGTSAGKSSIVRRLQWALPYEALHLCWDQFVEFVPPRCKVEGHDVPPEVTRRMIAGYHASLGAYAGAGNALIVETHFRKAAWVQAIAAALGDTPTWLVGVRCEVPELERREVERGDRPVGLARKQADEADSLTLGVYDLVLDTTHLAPEESAQRIARLLASGVRPFAFRHLLARLGEQAPTEHLAK